MTPGRPRSEQARSAALAAALRLVQRDGYPAVTIKAIAAEAGIGRQTVYRWWPTKADVLLDAVADAAADQAEPAASADASGDLRAMLRATFALTGVAGPVIAGLMAEATHDSAFAARLQGRLLAPRRAVLRAILVRGQRAGQFGQGVSPDLAVDLVFGTMWYRVLSGHAPVDQRLADELSTAVVSLLNRSAD
jgi:AcrR family transcriptional regulator